MENKIPLAIGTIITLALAISGTYYITQDDNAYYCEAKDLVMLCEKLSGGIGTRCYYEETYKICSEGWTEIEIGEYIEDTDPPTPPVLNDVPASSGGIKWLCSPEGCERIE